MAKPQAALIEIYDSHEVNLYSQVRFIVESGYELTLIVSEKHRETVRAFNADFHLEFVKVTSQKGLGLWKELWRIRRMILDRGIETVVFNTAHSNPVRNFCLLPFPKRVRFFGTLHGVNKLQGSLTQRIISQRIPRYFLLSDYMLDKARKVPHEGLRFSVFYPIFHPPFPKATLLQRQPGELWVAIPGSVEYKRRDYLSLVQALSSLPQRPPIRFLLLGNGSHADGNGRELKEAVEKAGVAAHFVFFDGYVPNEVLHGYMAVCDAVMPLIHPINSDMEKYLENQISGAFHLAFAYRKPLLMHRYFERYQDFRECSFFYGLEELSIFLSDLTDGLKSFDSAQAYTNPKWSFEYQRKHYADFLLLP